MEIATRQPPCRAREDATSSSRGPAHFAHGSTASFSLTAAGQSKGPLTIRQWGSPTITACLASDLRPLSRLGYYECEVPAPQPRGNALTIHDEFDQLVHKRSLYKFPSSWRSQVSMINTDKGQRGRRAGKANMARIKIAWPHQRNGRLDGLSNQGDEVPGSSQGWWCSLK